MCVQILTLEKKTTMDKIKFIKKKFPVCIFDGKKRDNWRFHIFLKFPLSGDIIIVLKNGFLKEHQEFYTNPFYSKKVTKKSHFSCFTLTEQHSYTDMHKHKHTTTPFHTHIHIHTRTHTTRVHTSCDVHSTQTHTHTY